MNSQTLHQHQPARPLAASKDINRDASRQLLTVPEVMAALRISKWALYKLIHSRRLKTVKIGARRLVATEDLQAFINQLRQAEKA